MPKENQTFIQKMAAFIVYKRKTILLIYIITFVFCIFAMGWVNVENDVTKYLPEDTETRQGIDVMNENFAPAATARIMVSNVTYEMAEELNAAIGQVDGVEMSSFDNTTDHYKDAAALFDVNFSGGNNEPETIQAMDEIRHLLEKYDASIDSLVGYDENAMLMNEMLVITVVAVIIVLVVLTLTSRAYAEVPVLILTFGAAALLNMGTNFIFGTISFISNSIAVVLQLALAVDYAIILCHRFSDEFETKPAIEAAIDALSKAIPEIGASSLTTIGGLSALAFMKFSIGADMAMVLVKSIFLSLLSVFTLMPGLLVFFSPLIKKTRHRKLLPPITLVGKFAVKVRYVLPPLFALLLVGAFYLSSDCPYCYSYNDLKTAKMAERQHAYFKIKETFGTSNMAAVIVPTGNYEAEGKILEELQACEQVESTMGLAGIEAMEGYMLTDALTPRELAEVIGLDNEITEMLYSAYALTENQLGQIINGVAEYRVPLFDMFLFLKEQMESNNIQLEGMEDMTDMLTQLDTARAQMRSDKYSRMVVYLNVPEEGEETYNFLQEMRGIIGQYYEDDYYIVGNSTSSRDLSASFETDNLIITVLSIALVALVLLGTFKSVGLAVLLVLVIQGSIWINFSVPTLTETPLYFLGYLIVSAVQMGANIDYAIVISSHYEEHKKIMSHKEAIVKALNEAFPTIFTSGTMLASAGMLIGNMTEQPVVSIMGMCIGRGTIISMILVILVLPSVLVFGNKLIEKTRFKLDLLSGGEDEVMKIGEAETADTIVETDVEGERKGDSEYA